ncbi:MAG TPA: OmpH family outer membrane protein [Thiolinea sp.]|nr:OmpH family outer membrane protein [Thiolinea sp.]
MPFLAGALLIMALASPLALAANSPAAGIPYRFAVVNMNDILKRSPQSAAEGLLLSDKYSSQEKALAEEQERLKQEREDLQATGDTLSERERVQRESELRIRQRTYSRKFEDLRENLRLDKDTALERLQRQVAEAIDAVRIMEGIDIVFKESDFIVASERVNMTEKVLDYLQRQFEDGSNANNAVITEPQE